MCYSADVTGSSFSVHRGLAAKLFTTLTLLGAIAVTVTGALGYFRVRHDVVTFLNGLFTRFNVAAQDLGIEKIKTVGDAYMAVCGLPVPVANHAEALWFAWLSAWSTSPASTETPR